jgi:hypothetical protein
MAIISVEFRVQGDFDLDFWDFALDFWDFKDCLEGGDGKNSVESVV